ncbi:hypothetical protein LM801457_50047 [Listeria monocytogenes]|nr:hypothetical protein LM801457_50047 [Listeria monocytogenes]
MDSNQLFFKKTKRLKILLNLHKHSITNIQMVYSNDVKKEK